MFYVTFREEIDKRGIMEPDQRAHRAYTSSPWYLFHMWTSAQIEQRAEVPARPKANIQSATQERWRLAQMSIQISVGARGAFPLILNICDIFKHWLVHRGNYKFIVTIMTCSSHKSLVASILPDVKTWKLLLGLRFGVLCCVTRCV